MWLWHGCQHATVSHATMSRVPMRDWHHVPTCDRGAGTNTWLTLLADTIRHYFDVIVCRTTCQPVCPGCRHCSQQAMLYFWPMSAVGRHCRSPHKDNEGKTTESDRHPRDGPLSPRAVIAKVRYSWGPQSRVRVRVRFRVGYCMEWKQILYFLVAVRYGGGHAYG